MDRVIEKRKSEHGDMIRVAETEYDGNMVRILFVNRSMESAVFLSKEKRNDLVFPYLDCLGYIMEQFARPVNVLMIGAGGFVYPSYYLRHYAGTMTACEIDEQIIQISRKYFCLSDAEDDERFRLVKGDGFAWLEKGNELFDVIINDAFMADKAQGNEESAVLMIKKHLRDDGIYVVNAVGACRGLRHMKLAGVKRMLGQVFAHTGELIAEPERDAKEVQNILLFASDRKFQ